MLNSFPSATSNKFGEALDEFKEYYYVDEEATNYRIINKVIVPTIKKMR